MRIRGYVVNIMGVQFNAMNDCYLTHTHMLLSSLQQVCGRRSESFSYSLFTITIRELGIYQSFVALIQMYGVIC